jgi:hypothetical protein
MSLYGIQFTNTKTVFQCKARVVTVNGETSYVRVICKSKGESKHLFTATVCLLVTSNCSSSHSTHTSLQPASSLGNTGFLFSRNVQKDSGAHTVSYTTGTGYLSSGGYSGRDVRLNHSPPSSSDVKNVCSYTPTPPYICRARCLITHTNNIGFTFI